MEFHLPENLQAELAAYDPTRKALIAQQREGARKPRSTYPLGLPDDLLPEQYVSKERQLAIVKELNTKPATERYYLDIDQRFIIHHHEKVWYAVWLPYSNEYKYIYGMSIAYKSTPSTADKISKNYIGRDDKQVYDLNTEASENKVKYGRTEFCKATVLITKQDILDGKDSTPWLNAVNAYGRSREKWSKIRKFQEKLAATIPSWKDSSGVFERIRHLASASSLINPCDKTEGPLTSSQIMEALHIDKDTLTVFHEPYFQKDFNATAKQINENIFNLAVESRRDAIRPFAILDKRIQWCKFFLSIYPDASSDYVQRIYQISINIDSIAYQVTANVRYWIRENMPVGSFVHILEKQAALMHKTWTENPRALEAATSHSTGIPSENFTDLRDTLQMMASIHQHQNKYNLGCSPEPLKLDPPSRWRISDWHDHVSDEAFKHRTTNEALPQDLFPTPVKVECFNKKWTFFQPIDVHQLGSWGSAVRNCVGNASSYREGIKKRVHFIVLIMVDQKPTFTAQLKLNAGIMTVNQIAGVANSRLNGDALFECETALNTALHEESKRRKQ